MFKAVIVATIILFAMLILSLTLANIDFTYSLAFPATLWKCNLNKLVQMACYFYLLPHYQV